jgi:hypothetical protein
LIIGASILLPIVSCLLITSLNSLSKTKFSWFKLENKLSLAVIGAGLILVHDYLVFIYLHTNINILYSLIILLYGLGQFLLINFAPQGKN